MYYLRGLWESCKELYVWLSRGVRSVRSCIFSWESINDAVNEDYFEEKDNYEKYGLVFTKDHIFKIDGRDAISVNKESGYVYSDVDEEYLCRETLPDGKVKAAIYLPREENEFCEILFIDKSKEKKSKIITESRL